MTKGGIPDSDIYTSTLKDDGTWSTPVRLPSTINTPYMEESVLIHPDGKTLYFSSQGHPGMGGLDIFVSRMDENGVWGKPENLGYPINTAADENSLLVSADGEIAFFASDRELAEEAYAGDVIGIPNHGVLRVGDSLSESGLIRFAGLPNFAPEILQRVRVKDPLKAKHLKKALEGLAEEGVTQLFRPEMGSDFIVGAVGQLQFEVMADRLGEEYGLEVLFEPSPWAEARWIGGTKADLEDFMGKYRPQMARDIDDDPVFLAKSSWETGYVGERFPAIAFTKTKERG